MQERYGQIILGAGASGLMLASMLKEKSGTLVLDANAVPGAKIAVSGGGRCNVTNRYVRAEHFLGDEIFVSQVLDQWDQHKTLEWFAGHGLKVIEEKNNQFFCSKSSKEILQIFAKATMGIEYAYGCSVVDVYKDHTGFVVETDCGRFGADRVVVATGGLSYPRLGASDIGYKIAKEFGHKVEPAYPALVGMTLQKEQFFFKDLSGISTEVCIDVEGNKIRGQMLFAHKGISGPAVLDASLYWRKGKMDIDFLPEFDWRILRNSRKQLSTLLPVPRRLGKALVEHIGVGDKMADRISAEDTQRLKILQKYSFAPAGTFGYSKAEVSGGGVDTSEVNPHTMESKIIDGLYFAGEVLDITGRLGGYNLQWAFSSAAVCAKAIQ